MVAQVVPKSPNTVLRIGVLISGRGSNLEALARAVREQHLPISIEVVLSDKPEARGLDIARSYNIPTLVEQRKPKDRSSAEYNAALVEVLKPFNLNLVVLAGFMRIITGEFIEAFEGRVVNIHPSLLPLYKGANAQELALQAGATESGCTVHYVVEEVDAGPIIAQRSVPVIPGDTVDALSARILTEEHKLLPAAIHAIARGDVSITVDKPRKIKFSAEVSSGPLGPFIKGSKR